MTFKALKYRIVKIFSSCLVLLLFNLFSLGQNHESGVTVLVHGFALFGNYNEEFDDFANDIFIRSGSNGTIYKSGNDGKWEFIKGSGNPNHEIILIDDWSNISWNYLRLSKDGDLEAAADNLFAMLMSPPSSLGISKAQLLQKKIHFIGHSRGCVLLLQVCHRLKRYFPSASIEQFTMLDPHPATPFGDIKTENESSIASLPCIKGVATACGIGSVGSCANGSSISIKIPENVRRADGYSRNDGFYEGVFPSTNEINFAAFDGVIVNNSYHYQLNNSVLEDKASIGGGAHSAVVAWYRGTISLSPTLINSDYIPYNNLWYTPQVGDFFTSNSTRLSVGYSHSRIGSNGVESLLPSLVPPSLKEKFADMDISINLRQGFGGGIQRVFNGNFNYGVAGWYGKGGDYDQVAGGIINNGYNNYFQLNPLVLGLNPPMLRHNYLFFGTDLNGNSYKSLRFTFHSFGGSTDNGLIVKFYSADGQLINESPIDITNSSNVDLIAKINIPLELIGQTGTFSIENLSSSTVFLGRFDLLISSATDMGSNTLVIESFHNSHEFELRWLDFSTVENSYRVEQSFNEDGPWIEIASLPSNSDHYNFIPQLSNTIYWFRIKADGVSHNPFTNIVFNTSAKIPNRPIFIGSVVSGSHQVLISWSSNNTMITGFNVFYSYNKNGSYDTLAKLGPGVTSFIHENVPSNTRIYYFVKAVDHNFSSLPSDTGFVSFLNPSATTLTRLEYYYDTDPGPGNGTAVNLNNAHAIDRHFDFQVSSLAEGVHQLYFRVQDNIGNWSNVYSNSFIKLKGNATPTIVDSVEYYFDQFDPGVGKATRIDLTLIAGPEYTIPVELSSLSDGAHILHLRSRNSKGLWSTYWSGGFIKLPGNAVSIIDKVEYFIDSDPGFGQGINVPINSLSKIDTSIHLNLSLVPTGLHKLFLRAKDAAGLWSNIFSRNFIRVLGDSGRYVTELEYYFDSEPGIGNGNKVSFPTPKAKVDTVLNLNLGALSDGMHMLYVRSKDVAGQWSNIIKKSFLRTTGSGGTPEIIKLEYYVDSDPGLGLASNIDTATLSPGVYNIELPTNAFALGEHNLYIRAKDSKGFWSVIYSGGFHIVNNTECSCAKLVYTTSKVSSASYQWQVDTGSGFRSIADTGVYFGTQTDSLKISNPPTSYAFNKYRCLITSPSGTSFSSTFELRYNMSWKGGESADWHDPKNWGCIVVPDENIDVVIPGSKPNYPILTKDSKVGSLKLESGSSVTVAPGVKLEIKR